MTEKRFGIARILNKRGFCSRSAAEKLVVAGRVALEGRIVRNPEAPATVNSRIAVDGREVEQEGFLYLAMNKPRGIVTTAEDERGRRTVMDLLREKNLPHVFPMGRLDKASEGLLLFTNDTAFADRILAPETHLEKEYHVRVDRVPTDDEMRTMRSGLMVPPRVFGNDSEWMQMENVQVLRQNGEDGWLSVVLHEGKNREIRRILETFAIGVLRLVRVRIGAWTLGDLKPGEVRQLSMDNGK